MASQKVQKLITFDRKTIIKMLDLNKETAQRVMDLEIPSLKTKKSGVPATNKDGFPRKIPGYMLYCNAFRDQVRGEDGKIESPQQAMKEAAENWKSMDTKEKKSWLDKASENFEKAKEAFLKENPDYEDSKKTKKVKVPKVKPAIIKAPRVKAAKKFFVEEFKSLCERDLTSDEQILACEKPGSLCPRMRRHRTTRLTRRPRMKSPPSRNSPRVLRKRALSLGLKIP